MKDQLIGFEEASITQRDTIEKVMNREKREDEEMQMQCYDTNKDGEKDHNRLTITLVE